jgi:uncharacterized membrane protein YcaP (DUF421 family)
VETIDILFGRGKDLTAAQMSLRSIVVFVICLVLLHLSGKRAFGMRTPIDNVIAILLGAVLGRIIVGASPFVPTVVAAATISLIHRLFAGLCVYSPFFGKITKGRETVIYENGSWNKKNMDWCMVTERDVMESLRLKAHTDSLDNIKTITVERSGEISIVKKDT